MSQDTGIAVKELRTDGGMVVNELLMQFQADILNVPVVRPKVIETTALGAAYAAGLAVGFWAGTEDLVRNWAVDRRWRPTWTHSDRRASMRGGLRPWAGRSTGRKPQTRGSGALIAQATKLLRHGRPGSRASP